MDNILEDLYEGRIYPSEQYSPTSEHYKKTREEYQKHYDDFKSKLDDTLAKEFENILDEKCSTISIELSEMFTYGFKIGAKMMMEILQETDTK